VIEGSVEFAEVPHSVQSFVQLRRAEMAQLFYCQKLLLLALCCEADRVLPHCRLWSSLLLLPKQPSCPALPHLPLWVRRAAVW
jgi:hypothetical protein